MSSIRNLLLKNPIFSALSIAGILGLVVGALTWEHLNPMSKRQNERNPATVFITSKKISMSGKANRPFQVDLSSDISSSFSETSDVKISANIVMLRAGTREVFYKWILPEGVSVVEGELEDSWSGVTAGKNLKIDISVLHLDPNQNQNIILQAWYEEAGARYAGSSIFSTKPDEVLENQIHQENQEQGFEAKAVKQ